MKKIYMLILATISFGISFSQVKDQPSPVISNGTGIDFIGSGQSFHQSFTAGITGELTQINLSLGAFTTGNIVVSIFSGSKEGANLGATPIESVSRSITGSGGAASLVSVFFTNANVVSGEKYSIKVASSGINVAYYGQGSNPYSGGQHTNKSGSADPSRDVFFETYVVEVIPVPTAHVLDLCNTSIAYNQKTFVESITGASQYRFEFSTTDSLYYSRENRQDTSLSFSGVDGPKLLPGETYLLDVYALGDGLDSQLVSACPINIYTPGETSLATGDCGRVITNPTVGLFADEVSGVEKYRFTFSAPGFTTIERTQTSSYYSFLTYQRYFAPGTEYEVTVQTLANGVISLPGNVCTIKTPGADQGNVLDCGKLYTSWSGVVKAEAQSGAQQYRFVFIDEVGNQQFSYASSRPYVKLNKVAGLNSNTEYSVKMLVRKDNEYGLPNDLPCTITTPGGVPARSGDAFVEGEEEIFMYPNPATGGYVNFTSPVHNLEVYDALGLLVKEEAYAENLDVSDLPSGMYILKSDEGLVKMMVK